MSDKHQAVFRRMGLMFGGMAAFAIAVRGDYMAALFGGVAVGVFSGAWFAYGNVLGERKLLRQGISTDQMDPIQERTLEVSASASAAFAACRSAILELRRAKVKEVRDGDNRLTAEVGVSWRSVGEIVTIQVDALGLGTSLVRVRSEPKLATTMVDYGKGVENVELFVRHLRGRLPEGAND